MFNPQQIIISRGNEETALYRAGVAPEGHFGMASEGITEHRSGILAATEQVVAISAEADTAHPTAAVAEAQLLLRCGGAPHFHSAIKRRGCDLVPWQ